MSNFVKYINQYLSTALTWADTYLGVLTDKNLSNMIIPELKYDDFDFVCVSNYMNDITQLNLGYFCGTFNKIRVRLLNDLQYFNENLANTNSENVYLKENNMIQNDKINKLNDCLEKSINQTMIDKNSLQNMRNDIKFYHDKSESLEKVCVQEDTIYKKILSDITKEFEILYEIINNNYKFKNFSEFLFGFSIDLVKKIKYFLYLFPFLKN